MKIIGLLMFIAPICGWIWFCTKTLGWAFVGKVVGGFMALCGWYLLAYHFMGVFK